VVITCARRNDPPYVETDHFQINAGKLNTSKVTYTFTAPRHLPVQSWNRPVRQRSACSRIVLRFEPGRNQPVRPLHNVQQPAKNAIIRIFNLAGQMVRTLEKSSDSQFLRWDLMNMRNYPSPAASTLPM